MRHTLVRRGRCTPHRGLAFALMAVLVAPCAADLTLQDVTLGGALERIAESSDLEYVLCGDTKPQVEVALRGATPPELVQSAVGHFACRVARVGDLFLIDARPRGLSVHDTIWTYFGATSRLGTLPAAPPENPRVPVYDALWELWEARYKSCFPAPTGVVRLAPFVAEPTDELGAHLCRDSYVEIATANARDHMSTPPDDAWLTLVRPHEGVYVLQLNWKTGTSLSSIALGGPLVEARMQSSPDPASLGRWIEAYLTPGELRTAAPRGMPAMEEPVSVQGGMPLAEAATRIAEAGPPVRAAEDVGHIEVRANLVERPRWAALTLLSVASGIPWGPRDLATEYSLQVRPQSLTDRLWAAMSPMERLAWEVTHAPIMPSVAELVWAVLEEPEREALKSGQRVPVTDLAGRPRAAAVYDLVTDWRFRQPSRDATVRVVETDRIWDRLGGACGTFAADDATVQASRYAHSGSRRNWPHPTLSTSEEVPSPAADTLHQPWQPSGHPPKYRRPFGRIVQDGRSGGPRSREYEEPRLLGEAPGAP